MAVTLSFQPSGPVPGNAQPVSMQGGALTIGRGPANDLVLPDPDRMLSKNHCVIEDQSGNVVVIDLSTNGTFLNYSRDPLGPTPTPLNNGDVLTLGLFELVVSITDESAWSHSASSAPMEQASYSPGSADAAPSPMDLLNDVGPEGDFLDDLLGSQEVPSGPAQIDMSDPIDELLPPAGEEEDSFFNKTSDGREGEGASIGMNASGAQDSFAAPRAERAVIPDEWDKLLDLEESSAPKTPEPRREVPPSTDRAFEPPAAAQAPQETPPAEEPSSPSVSAFEPPDPIGARSTSEVSESPAPAPAQEGRPPRSPFEAGIPEPQPQETPSAKPRPKTVRRTERTVPSSPALAEKGHDPKRAAAKESDPARAFLAALGADDIKIDDEDLAETMIRAGEIMRLLVCGIREILMTRTSIKSEFRIEQTRIGAGANNPLKFSISPEQAIEVLLTPRKRGYLPPGIAAQEALDDIKAHEVAMVAGMEAAIKGVLSKLSPDELAGRIEDSGRLTTLLRGKKAQYWDVYEKIYGEISDQAENDFQEFFSREFALAYKQQLERLKG